MTHDPRRMDKRVISFLFWGRNLYGSFSK